MERASVSCSATKTFRLHLVDLTKGAGVKCETIEGLCDELAIDGTDGDNTKIGTSAGNAVAGSVSLLGGLLARQSGIFAGLPCFLFCPRGLAQHPQ